MSFTYKQLREISNVVYSVVDRDCNRNDYKVIIDDVDDLDIVVIPDMAFTSTFLNELIPLLIEHKCDYYIDIQAKLRIYNIAK